MSNLLYANDIAKELNLKLKIVVSIKSFDSYNSFFNIYGEEDEACRRIVILTKDEKIEEVYDENPGVDIIPGSIIEDNIWIKEYPLTINPGKINLDSITISTETYNTIKDIYK